MKATITPSPVTIELEHNQAVRLMGLLGMLRSTDYARIFADIGKASTFGVDLDNLLYEMYEALSDVLEDRYL